jgi:hypothetical protein
MPWFRMYAEFATDPVVQSLDFGDQRHFVMTLCMKASGLLDKKFKDSEQRTTIIRRVLGLDAVAYETAMKRLVTAGLVSEDWQPINWCKRQFLSDTSTNRVRAFRKRSRNSVVTPSDTDTDTDTDTEQNKKPPIPLVIGLDSIAWTRFYDYRKQIRRPLKPASIPSAQRQLAAFGADQLAVVEQTMANGWQGLFELKRVATKAPFKFRTPEEIEAEEAARAQH